MMRIARPAHTPPAKHLKCWKLEVVDARVHPLKERSNHLMKRSGFRFAGT
jgi:RimJ/RimL family protein N-acetyltransferase